MLAVGWNATLTLAGRRALGNVRTTSPVLLFQTLTVPSPPAEARHSPSGLNATLLTSVLSRRTSGSDPAEPHEVVPLPPAQVLRALVE